MTLRFSSEIIVHFLDLVSRFVVSVDESSQRKKLHIHFLNFLTDQHHIQSKMISQISQIFVLGLFHYISKHFLAFMYHMTGK